MIRTLPSGKVAQIGVHHSLESIGPDRHLMRGTRVRLTIPGSFGGLEVEVRSVCKPPDQFSKRVGRRLAASRLLEQVKETLNKEDRRVIFQLICPEYFKSETPKQSNTP